MYKDLLTKGLIFVAGVACGAVASWKIVKSKYERITEEEIESVKEAFSGVDTASEPSGDSKNEEHYDAAKEELEEYKEMVEETGYSTKSDDKKEEEEDMEGDKPYVITPEEYGDCDYTMVSLTLYEDGTITNDQDKIVTNVDELVGNESLDHFGEYEDDSVFVRNDKLKIDFEILKDYRNYSEIG